MGGKAFSLPNASFPRIPTSLYASIKSRVHLQLAPLFQLIDTPREAPEKADHGDVDTIVACPRHEPVRLEDIQAALGAHACVRSLEPTEKGTSNYAVPLATYSTSDDPASRANEAASAQVVYVQVDVHICTDSQEYERIMILHAYGDLGMILGRVANGVGLQLGTKGLKVS
jgi:hypothetical protein